MTRPARRRRAASGLLLVLAAGMSGPAIAPARPAAAPEPAAPFLRDGHRSGSSRPVLDTPMAWAAIAFDAADNLTAGSAERPIAP